MDFGDRPTFWQATLTVAYWFTILPFIFLALLGGNKDKAAEEYQNNEKEWGTTLEPLTDDKEPQPQTPPENVITLEPVR